MSRNRPRPRDNGFGNNEELELWTKICQDIRKSKEKFDQQNSLSAQIKALVDKIAHDGNQPTMAEHDQLDSWLRLSQKLSEDERSIMQDEPCDVIKNLELLTALRKASEAEAPPNRSASFNKSRKKRNEIEGSVTDSPSASGADKTARSKGDRPTQRKRLIEEGPSEGTKGTAAERSGLLVVGAEVVFKHNKNKQGVEGEGIQCIIKAVSGDGPKKRYDVQDPEPNENGEQGAVYRTTAASLIPIPQLSAHLSTYPVGKQVLARYPDTTTFYRAEVMGARKDVYRLKFEGEEDDKEMEVDRRFVLDILGK
ncbi:hypothetical protein N7519_011431 [Penicillium mononematosum]|uniref:uncharacterized protein n=1 Tax=Penicillium mononematosum TaxID=268346 RepID=UPI002548EA49|nr:uncharacterized protein N7519_011431 [Penicillium mononematosum]KAJ6180970.1 hypothetical protein N7519_011431 [Penicillium mononematosum]